MQLRRLGYTFSPGPDLGISGDKIRILVKPCCRYCIYSVDEFYEAIEKINILVQCGKTRHPVGQIYNWTKTSEAVSHPSVDGEKMFAYTIDYADLLPHAPEADLFIILKLKLARKQCKDHIKILGLPVGVGDIVEQFHGEYSIHVTGKLDPARLHL